MAILRLASATERVANAFDALMVSSGPDIRSRSRELVQDIVNFLDAAEGDLDLEGELLDDASEELENDDPAEDDGTAEPSLGSLERHPTLHMNGRDNVGDQTQWAVGNRDDREDEHDGAEPDVDDEPSLGWTEACELGEANDKEAGDDYDGRVIYLDKRRASSPIHKRPGFWRGPHDAA
jgi:hypothetical protein